MQTVTVLFPCQLGKGKDLLDALSVALVDTRAFDGCKSVKTFVDADNPDNVVLIEEWDSRSHNDRYMAWRVESGLIEMLAPILARPLDIHFLDPHPA